MKIGDVIKRAFEIVWRWKILWLFGLLAAEAGGGSASFNSGGNFNSGSSSLGRGTSAGAEAFLAVLQRIWPLLLVGALFMIVVGIAWWILSVAARGGIVRLTSDADEGREVRAVDGWSTGFHYWGRVFLQQIMFALPILAVVLVVLLLFALLLGGTLGPIIASAGSGAQASSALFGRILGLTTGACGLFLILFVLVFGIGILYLVWVPLSLRFAILYDRPAIKAMGDGWNLLRARLGKVALAGVTIWGLSLAFGIAVGLASIVLILPAVGFGLARMWIPAAGIGVVWLVLVVFAGAVFSAFYSTYWTIAFRRIMDIGENGAPIVAGDDAPDPGAGAGYLPAAPAPPIVPRPQVQTPAEPAAPEGDLGAGTSDVLITQPAGDGSPLPDVPPPLPASDIAPPPPPAVPRPPKASDRPTPPGPQD